MQTSDVTEFPRHLEPITQDTFLAGAVATAGQRTVAIDRSPDPAHSWTLPQNRARRSGVAAGGRTAPEKTHA